MSPLLPDTPTWRRLIVTAIAVVLLLVQAAEAVAAARGGGSSGSDSDYPYSVFPRYVEVAPAGVVPQTVPNCITNSTAVPSYPTLVCYSPNFLRAAYAFDKLYAGGLNGWGQTIVIVDAYGSPTIEADLRFFDATFGLPEPPSFQVVCPLGCPTFNPNNAPHDQEGWSIETTLDVQWSHALAPGANIVLAVAPSNAGNAINSVISYVVDHYPGAIISQSFGIPEAALAGNNAQIAQAHANYVRAADQSLTVLASSGDDGATNGDYPAANALFPSSDPYVLSIGGTQGGDYPYGLATYRGTCPTGFRPGYPGCTPTGYGSEQTWNEAWQAISTGGAPSLIYAQPSYQAGVATGTSQRATPDVSMNAAVNGGVLVYYSATGPRWFVVGGTSASCPEWGALLAIVNQARAAAGHGPLGMPHAAIYALAQSSAYGRAFHDITEGNNINEGSSVGFFAGPGWDMATGWGTPNAANVVAALR